MAAMEISEEIILGQELGRVLDAVKTITNLEGAKRSFGGMTLDVNGQNQVRGIGKARVTWTDGNINVAYCDEARDIEYQLIIRRAR